MTVKTGREKPADASIYFENVNGRIKFRPNFLAQDIEEEYKFKYVEGTGKFYIYTGTHWKDQAKRIIEEECNTRLEDKYEPSHVTKVVEAIKTRPHIRVTQEDFRPAKKKVPFKNGVYNAEKGELVEHQAEDNFTHIIPYEYDTDAQCPKFNEFLDQVTSQKADKELILETIGYSLLADYPYAHALLLNGKGKNGKTVLLQVWKTLLTIKNYKEEDLQQLEHGRFATRWLYGKLGLFSDDLPSTKLESGSTIKSLTGGGETRAEIKGGDHFDFKSYATPVFACNEIPESNDDSEGFFRRWEIINFPYKFVDNPVKENHKQKKDKQELISELTSQSEIKGLINEAVTRLEIILETGGIENKTDAETTRSLWNSYSSPVSQFFENCIEQGMTQKDAEEMTQKNMDAELGDFSYDFILKDDLVFLLDKYCSYYGHRAPSKTAITQRLKNTDAYYVQEGRTRQLGDDNKRERVYKFIKFTDEFVEFVQKNKECPECPYFFPKLRAHACKLKQSLEKTQDTQDRVSVGEKIEHFVKQSDSDAVDEENIIEEIDVDDDKLEAKINALKKNGILYRPKPGEVKLI